MIPLQKHREVQSSEVEDSIAIGISAKDKAHLLTIFRDTLYSDKVLAVLREYSSNAWDAHREVGKGDVPIEVHIPTWQEPYLKIQDWGPGLSHEDVRTVYSQAGASTKRQSNRVVGTFGIGALSGHSYCDTFTIVSCHGGMRRTYVAVLDESEEGQINLLSEEPCGDETGVTIQIAVRNEDIREFVSKAETFFVHFDPKPSCNIALPGLTNIQQELPSGVFTARVWRNGHYSTWYALMGCVAYPIDLHQLRESNGTLSVPSYFLNTSGVLRVGIGEVQISASREALKYSKFTNEALVARFKKVDEELTQALSDQIASENRSDWAKRLLLRSITRNGIPIPEAFQEFGREYVFIPYTAKPVPPPAVKPAAPAPELDCPETFKFKEAPTHIYVDPETCIYLIDDDRPLRGFRVHERLFIDKDPDATWDEVRYELGLLLKKWKISGIPVKLLSKQPWEAPPEKARKPRAVNNKHRRRVFKFVGGDRLAKPHSADWEAVDREPTDDDVYVILVGFLSDAPYEGNLHRLRGYDREIAEAFNLPLPPLYGYKSTPKKPVTPADLRGTPYEAWRKKFHEEILAMPSTQKLAEQWRWTQQHLPSAFDVMRQNAAHIRKTLGAQHLISRYVEETLNAKAAITPALVSAFRYLQVPEDLETSAAQVARKKLAANYPLVDMHGTAVLWSRDMPHWLQYVLAIDAYNNKESDNE